MSDPLPPSTLPTGVAPIPPERAAPAAPEPLNTLDARTPPPATPPPAPQPAVSDDGVLRPIQESDYFTLDAAAIRTISANIDEYYNQPLDLFPFWETDRKPDRYHVLFARQMEERFPVDRDIRGRIHGYGRRVFDRLRTHVGVKRLVQGLTLVALGLVAVFGPAAVAAFDTTYEMALGVTVGLMLVAVGVFAGVQHILFTQYRFRLENDSYGLSREIVQRTRELQNLFTNARAMSDQAETQFSVDGKGWGERALFLTRLTMWIGARMEHLEKYVQMELWRVRRERYWMGWFGGLTTVVVFLAWGIGFAFWPAPVTGEAGFRALQAVAALLAFLVSALSFFRWRTPASSIKDKLGVDGWVRYASLDVDNTVGDQVRRDKERLVEYRALTRGR